MAYIQDQAFSSESTDTRAVIIAEDGGTVLLTQAERKRLNRQYTRSEMAKIDEEVLQIANSWAADRNYPTAKRWRRSAGPISFYKKGSERPYEPFLWSGGFGPGRSNAAMYDHIFNYSQCEGMLNILRANFDERVRELPGMQTARNRMKHFYIPRVFTSLVVIHEAQIRFIEAARKQAAKEIEKVEKVESESIIETVFDDQKEEPIIIITPPTIHVTMPEMPEDEQHAEYSVPEVPRILEVIEATEKETVDPDDFYDDASSSGSEGDLDAYDVPSDNYRFTMRKKFVKRMQVIKRALKTNHISECCCDICIIKWLTGTKFSSFANIIIDKKEKSDIELQCDEVPASLKSKELGKMCNSARQIERGLGTMQDKVYKLCHRGRFAYQTRVDQLMFHKMQVKINEIFLEWRKFLWSLPYAQFHYNGRERHLAFGYVEMVDEVLCYTRKAIKKMQEETFDKVLKHAKKITDYVLSLKNIWDGAFDVRRMSEREPATVEEVERDCECLELQGDEAPKEDKTIVKAKAPVKDQKSTTSATKPKAPPRKVRNVKRGNVKGTIKKLPKKEDKAVTEGKQKVNIVMADERTVQKEKFKKSVTAKKDSNAEVNNDMDKIWKRWMMISRKTWDASTPVDYDLFSFVLPGAYFTFKSKEEENKDKTCLPLTVNNMLSQYGFTRFDMKIRIQINSNKFQSGIMVAYFEPFTFKERSNYVTRSSITNLPHVWINACESNSIEMTIPWMNMRDYFPIYWDNHTEYNYWGIFHLAPWTKLAAGEKTSPNATVTVYMCMDNWEVHQQVAPKPAEAITFTTDLMPIDFPNYKLSEARTPSTRLVGYKQLTIEAEDTYAEDMLEVQMMEAAGEMLGPMASAMAMEAVAGMMSRVRNDKPLAPTAAPPTKIEVLPTTAPGDGPNVATTLGLTTKRQTPMRLKLLDTVKPVGLRELLTMESYLGQFQWRVGDEENTELFSLNVNPMVCDGDVSATYQHLKTAGEKWTMDPTSGEYSWKAWDTDWDVGTYRQEPTMLSYLSKLFLLWRGSIIFRFQASKNTMQTGRLAVKYEATGGKITESECSRLSKPIVIWDVNEADELKIVCEYASAQPFLSTLYEGVSYGIKSADIIGATSCGHLEVFVVNALKASVGVSQAIDVNIFISGGPDFEFSGLQDLSPIVAIGKFPITQIADNKRDTNYRNEYFLQYLWKILIHQFTSLIDKNDPGLKSITKGDLEFFYKAGQFRRVFFLARLNINTDRSLFDIITAVEQIKKANITSWRSWIKDVDKVEPVNVTWHEDIARDYYRTKKWLYSHFQLENKKFWELLPHSMLVTVCKMLPLAYMDYHALTLNHFPDDTYFPLFYKEKGVVKDMTKLFDVLKPATTEIEMQGDETEGGLENKPSPEAINPFTDGTVVDMASVHELNGEDFNDFYKICRRFYCFKRVLIPEYRPNGTSFTQIELDLLRMNDEEIQTMYWDIKIPVTPCQDWGHLGLSRGYCYKPPNVGRFCSSIDYVKQLGVKWGQDGQLTPLGLFSEIFTFWRGSMRYMIYFPKMSAESAFVVHQPYDYSPFGVQLQSEAKVLQHLSYGTCMYKGNVMGGMNVEVPWQQKYSRLVLSRNSSSAITQNGTLHVYVPVQRLTSQIREAIQPADVYKHWFDQSKIILFHAFGDDTEMLVPRAAPPIWTWKYFAENRADDGWEDGNYEIGTNTIQDQTHRLPHEVLEDGMTRRVIPYYNNKIMNNPMIAHEFKVKPNETFPDHRWTYIPAGKFADLQKLLQDRNFSSFYKTITAEIEMQGDDDDTNSSVSDTTIETSTPEVIKVTPETYKRFSEYMNKKTKHVMPDVTDGPCFVTWDSIMEGLINTTIDLPVAIDKFAELMEKATSSWSLTESAVRVWKSAGEKISAVGEKVEGAVGYAWDGMRLGVIAYSIYQFLNAEDMNGRLMALASAALALGLSYDTVQKAFGWLVSSVTELFSWNQGSNAGVIPQGLVPDTFKEFIAENVNTFQLIASAIGAFAIFSFTPNMENMTGKVSNFSSNMIQKLKNFQIVGSAIKTFDWLFRWIGDVFKWAFEWACDLATGGMFTKSLLSNKYPELLEWLCDIEKYGLQENKLRAFWDINERYNVWRLMDKGTEFAKTFDKSEQFLKGYVKSGMTKLTLINQEICKEHFSVPVRTDPYCIWLYGDPGVGKSASAAYIANFICDYLGLPVTNRIYSRNENDDYWSEYVGQPVVFMDDAAQFRESQGLNDFIKVKTNCEYPLNMAACDDKGRKFQSKIVIATSNAAHPRVENMTSNEALWRRRNVLVQVTKLDKTKENSFDNLRIHELNPLNPLSRPSGPGNTLAEFVAKVALDCSQYLDRQDALVFSQLQGRKIEVTGEVEDERDRYIASIVCESSRCFSNFEMPDADLLERLNGLTTEDWDRAAEITKGLSENCRKMFNRGKLLRKGDEALSVAMARSLKQSITVNANLIEQAEEYLGETLDAPAGVQTEVLEVDNEKYAQLRQQAEEMLEKQKAAYKMCLDFLKTETRPVKWIKLANRQEIERYVRSQFPHASQKQNKLRADDYEFIYKQVQQVPVNKTNVSATAIFGDIKYTKYFKKNQKGDWELDISATKSIDDYTDEELEVTGIWESQLVHLTKDTRNEMLNNIMEPTKEGAKPVNHTTWYMTIKTWILRQTAKVKKYFNDHPWIIKAMKTGLVVASFFVGYRLLKVIAGDWVSKIEQKLCYIFGLASETRPVKYVKQKGTEVKEYVSGTRLAKKLEEWKDRIWGTNDVDMEGSSTDQIVEEEITKLIPSALVTAGLRVNKGPQAYYAGDGKTMIRSVAGIQLHGTSDPTCTNIQTAVSKNLVRLIVNHNGKTRKMGGFFLKYRYLVTPVHLFDGVSDGETIGIIITTDRPDVREYVHYDTFEAGRFTQLDECDAGIFRCSKSCPTFRDISKHFVTQALQESLPSTDAVMTVRGENGDMVKWITRATGKSIMDYSKKIQQYKLRKNLAWAYAAGTQKGDCGGLLFAVNPALQKKILGMHIAGKTSAEEGYAVCLTYEMLEEALARIADVDVEEEAVLQYLVEDNTDYDTLMPEGKFEILGTLKSPYRTRLPFTTEIKKSPIHGLVREPVTEPAILTVRDDRWNFRGSPLIKAVSKYGELSKPFLESDVKYAVEHLASYWDDWSIKMTPRVLTDWEAIYGNELIPFCDRMNMASSPGFPYVVYRSKGRGKEWLYDISSEDGIANGNYRELYREREEKAKNLIGACHLWTTCLKDERRPFTKIEQGKTRAFVIPSADFTQVFRKYFLAFCVNFYGNHSNFYSAVGCDPYSRDWTVIWNYLKEVSTIGFGIDFQNFDGLTNPDIVRQLCLFINKWYKKFDMDWKKEHDNVRITLLEDCMSSKMIVGKTIVKKFTGNPSGCPITTILNTLVQKAYQCLAWIKIMRIASLHWSLDIMKLNIREILYGDDGVISVNPELVEIFNLKTVSTILAQHGIVSTGEDKADEKYEVRPLADCTFLKNGFVKMKGRNLMLAPIAQDTIYELTNWVRKSDDDYVQLRANLDDAMKFAFHHGRTFFDQFKERVNEALFKRNLRSITTTFEHEREEFLEKCI